MGRRAAHLFRITGVPVALFFLGTLVGGAVRRLRRRAPAPERTPALRPVESWRPEPPRQMEPGAERASVIGYQRAAPTAPDVPRADTEVERAVAPFSPVERPVPRDLAPGATTLRHA